MIMKPMMADENEMKREITNSRGEFPDVYDRNDHILLVKGRGNNN